MTIAVVVVAIVVVTTVVGVTVTISPVCTTAWSVLSSIEITLCSTTVAISSRCSCTVGVAATVGHNRCVLLSIEVTLNSVLLLPLYALLIL
jgi:hypothetical protein